MEREKADISNSDDINDEIFISDDDSYLEEAYQDAMMNPLLERLVNCNKSPYRIVTITQPRTENTNLQPAAVSNEPVPVEPLIEQPLTKPPMIEPAVSQTKFNELTKLVEQLTISQSLQNGHITWLLSQKQEMQRQIDFLHAVTSPPHGSTQVCNGASRGMTSEVIAPRRADLETQTRAVGIQTEEPHPAPCPTPSLEDRHLCLWDPLHTRCAVMTGPTAISGAQRAAPHHWFSPVPPHWRVWYPVSGDSSICSCHPPL
jgi:hypothetical protein